ncbi:MAG: hypothetical protein ACTSUY_03790 [Alphaproteobacteria bacterium]
MVIRATRFPSHAPVLAKPMDGHYYIRYAQMREAGGHWPMGTARRYDPAPNVAV